MGHRESYSRTALPTCRSGFSHDLATVDGVLSPFCATGSPCEPSGPHGERFGQVHYGLSEAERESMRFRRGLYFVRGLAEREVIDETAVRSLRPAAELEPDAIGDDVGRRTQRAVRRGDPVTRDHLA